MLLAELELVGQEIARLQRFCSHSRATETCTYTEKQCPDCGWTKR